MKFGKKSTLVSAYCALATVALGAVALDQLARAKRENTRPDPSFGWVAPLEPFGSAPVGGLSASIAAESETQQ